MFLSLTILVMVLPMGLAVSAAGGTKTISVTVDRNYKYAYEVLDLINSKRTASGLPRLTMDKELLYDAMYRAAETVVYWNHIRPNGSKWYSLSSNMHGENIGAGYTTPSAAVNAWMNSAGHRSNILYSEFRSIGIGCVKYDGLYYWVQDFSRSSGDTANQSNYSNGAISYNVNVLPSNLRLSYSMSNGTTLTNNTSKMKLYTNNGFVKVPLSGNNFSFSTSNSSVATVTSDGVVTPKGNGSATITASASTAKVSVNVRVNNFVSNVKLNKSSITLGVGESYQLTASGSSSYSWSSNLPSIVSVSGGKITANTIGTATVTVTDANKKTASCTVTVKPAPTSVSLNKTNITLGVGETYDLDSTVNGGSASYVRNYTSNNSSVATAPMSIITAKKVGTATITVKTYNGKSATCKVTVKPAPTSVSLNKTNITLGVGETYDLDSTVNGGSASYVRNYTSNNSSVATAPMSIITAKKVGTATITVKTYNGKSATCKVTVN